MRNVEKIRFFGDTDAGKRRTNNEDAFVAEKLGDSTVLVIVIDGVGGYEGGEVAAEIAQKEIPSYLKEFNRGERLELLKQAVVCANNAIFDRRQLDTARPNMSCVLTSALIDADRKVLDMVHVGDTRMYQYHNGELLKLSHDHSYVGYCEEINELTEEQAMRHPRRNEISRSVGEERHGVNDQSFLDAEEFPLLPNSTFLLCSDGLTDMITSKQIVAILEQKLPIEKKVQALIDAANNAGGKDNVTVVLVEYHDEDPVRPAENVTDSRNQDGKTQNLNIGQPCKKCKKSLSLDVISFFFVALLLPFIVFLSKHRTQDVEIDTLESATVVPSDTIIEVNAEEKEFTFMYDVDSDHPWSCYMSMDTNYVLRLEKLYEDSLGCSFRAFIFEPEYWRNGSMHYPPFGEEPTYEGYGTSLFYYDGGGNQQLEFSFIRANIGMSGETYAFVLSGDPRNWDSVLTSNPVPAPWLSIEDNYEIPFKKLDWQDIQECWEKKQRPLKQGNPFYTGD